LLGIEPNDKFFVVFDARADRLVALFDALKLHESGNFSHGSGPV
jgi:hypothetical protein